MGMSISDMFIQSQFLKILMIKGIVDQGVTDFLSQWVSLIIELLSQISLEPLRQSHYHAGNVS